MSEINIEPDTSLEGALGSFIQGVIWGLGIMIGMEIFMIICIVVTVGI
jgi:amino acid transporter